MSAKFEYLQEDKILVIRPPDTYILNSEVDLLKEIVIKANEYNCSRIFVDLRATTVTFKTITTFSRPKLFEELGFGRTWKGALVFKKLDNETAFYENVFQNRGWMMGVFDDYDTAMNWLKE